MTDNATLQQRLTYANKRVAFAWAKYYEAIETNLATDHRQYETITQMSEDSIPTHIKNELKTMATELKKRWECPICLDMIESGDLQITNCGHFYCKGCLEQLIKTHKDKGDTKWTCATCRKKTIISER